MAYNGYVYETLRIEIQNFKQKINMKKEQKQQDNTEPSNVLYTLLGEVKFCPFTGKKYDAVRKVKCTCECHAPNVTIMHFMPCCDNGYVEEYRYID